MIQSGIESKILYWNFKEYNLIEKCNLISCIRFYESEERLLAIPFVFFPPLKKENVFDFCCGLLDVFNIGIPNFFINNKKDLEIVFYQWTVRVLSEILINQFLDEFSFISFNKFISCDESFLFDKNSVSSLNIPLVYNDPNDFNSENEIVCSGCFDECINKEIEIDRILKKYLIMMRQKDDQRGICKLDRFHGIRLYKMWRLLKNNKFDINIFVLLSKLISFLDCGKASYVIMEDSDDNYMIIDGYFRHGEQIFSAYFELYNNVYNVFYELYHEFYETRKEKLLQYAKYFDKQYSTTLFSEFVDGIYYEQYGSDVIATEPQMISNKFIVLDAKKEIRKYILSNFNKEKT